VAERCLTGGMPNWTNNGSFRRIVQTPAASRCSTTWVKDKGWQRNIVMNGSPICSHIRQWYGTRAVTGGQYSRD